MYPALTPELSLRLAHRDAIDRLAPLRPAARRRSLRTRLGHVLVVAGTRLERPPGRHRARRLAATMAP